MCGFYIGFSPTLDLEGEHQQRGKISTNKSDLQHSQWNPFNKSHKFQPLPPCFQVTLRWLRKIADRHWGRGWSYWDVVSPGLEVRMLRAGACVRKPFLSHLIGSQLRRKSGCLAQPSKIHNIVIGIWEGPFVSDTHSGKEAVICPLQPWGLSLFPTRTVETPCGMTEHRVMPDKRKREESRMADWRLVLY